MLCVPALQGFTVRCAFGPNGVLLRGEHFDIGPRWYAGVGETLACTYLPWYAPPPHTSPW